MGADGLMKILAISGSLRAASSNTALLRAARALAPEGVEVELFEGLAGLPHFNPDDEAEEVSPESVRAFRSLVRDADAVLICSPEYAHGVPGSLKNALDWLVGSGEFFGKPVATINASARAVHAEAALVETLGTMGSRMVPEAIRVVPVQGRGLDDAGMIQNTEIAEAIRASLIALREALETQ